MSLLFPNRCRFCGKVITEDKPVCLSCLTGMPRLSGQICERCGRELTLCTCKIGDFAFERNISLYRYDTVASEIIKRIKYYRRPQLGVYMAKELYKLITAIYESIDFDYITYVPMLFLPTFKRGYNQAEVMASTLSELMSVPCVPLIYRKYGMRPQKSLNARDRRKNVRDKFYTIADLSGKTVLLVDDVMTTGSTLSECALMLRRAGVDKVYCATFAITCKK